MTLFESGNIKQSFGRSISPRGTLDQKLQPGNNNNIAKIKICKNGNLVSLHFIWLRSLKICIFQAIIKGQYAEIDFDNFQTIIEIELGIKLKKKVYSSVI